ncbi:MAG TPA: hypothetical protein O0Y06_07115 [Methanocorpusculum sp.]|nr:hypothetical protein [Methanocorpusculum sp.]HJK80654.1 hypothetical protein [Methanocorpusculum sp.]
MMYAEKRYLEIYHLSQEKNLFYDAFQRDHASYEVVLNYLLRRCDRFSLEREVFSKDTQKTNGNEPQIYAKVYPYFLEKQCIETEYPGADKNTVITRQFKEISRYQCCQESIAAFGEYENFFAIDDQVNICFFTKEKCILQIISHEDQYLIDPNFFADLPEFLETEKKLYPTIRRLREMDHETYLSCLRRYLTTCDRYTLSTRPSGTLENSESVSYPCNEETIHALEQYENFLSLGSQTSIAFYYQDACVCYTLPDEGVCVLDELFLHDPHVVLKPFYQPLRLAYRAYCTDYQYCLEKGHLYSLQDTTHTCYLHYLAKLFSSCHSFVLINHDPDNSEKRSPVHQALARFETAKNISVTYPGIWEYTQKITKNIYECCPESMQILEKLENFFSMGEHIDIMFCRYDKCVLYTLSDEQLCILDLWTLGEIQPGFQLSPVIKIDKSNISEPTLFSIMNAAGVASRAGLEEYLLRTGHTWEIPDSTRSSSK